MKPLTRDEAAAKYFVGKTYGEIMNTEPAVIFGAGHDAAMESLKLTIAEENLLQNVMRLYRDDAFSPHESAVSDLQAIIERMTGASK